MMKKQLMKITTYFVFFVMLMGAVTIDTNAFYSKKKLEKDNSLLAINSQQSKQDIIVDTKVESAEQLCNATFDGQDIKKTTSKDYTKAITGELRKINSMYNDCYGSISGLYSNIYAVGYSSIDIQDIKNQASNYVEWVTLSGGNECDHFRFDSYKLLAGTYCSIGSSEDSNGANEDWKDTNIEIGNLSCDSIKNITEFVGRIYKIGFVFLVVGLIVLTMLDYGKAVMSSEQDIMKKANKHLITRIIILVIFLLLPILINMSIELFLKGKDIKSCLDFKFF